MLNNNTEIKENITDKVPFVMTEGNIFSVLTKQGELCYYKIQNDVPQKVLYFNLEKKETAERSFFVTSKVTEKVMAKVLYIENDKVGIEVYLNNGKTQRVLNDSYVNILKRKELLYVGAEFNILHTIDDDGTSTKILNREAENSAEVDDFYEELIRNLG